MVPLLDQLGYTAPQIFQKSMALIGSLGIGVLIYHLPHLIKVQYIQVESHFHNDRGCRFGAIPVEDWFGFVYIIIQKPKHPLPAELIKIAFH